MGLTPEERHQIYEEEKARLEAQGRIGSEKRQKTGSRIAIGFVVILGLLALLWLLGFLSDESRKLQPSRPIPTRYHVDSYPGEVDVSFTNDTGGTDHVRLNQQHWDKNISLPPGTIAYVTAQNTFDYGHVTVTIVCNGQEAKRSESNGGYAVATASVICR